MIGITVYATSLSLTPMCSASASRVVSGRNAAAPTALLHVLLSRHVPSPYETRFQTVLRVDLFQVRSSAAAEPAPDSAAAPARPRWELYVVCEVWHAANNCRETRRTYEFMCGPYQRARHHDCERQVQSSKIAGCRCSLYGPPPLSRQWPWPGNAAQNERACAWAHTPGGNAPAAKPTSSDAPHSSGARACATNP